MIAKHTMMAICGNVVRDSVFAISAVNLLSGFLYFVDAHESTTSVLNLFLKIIFNKFSKEDGSERNSY